MDRQTGNATTTLFTNAIEAALGLFNVVVSATDVNSGEEPDKTKKPKKRRDN